MIIIERIVRARGFLFAIAAGSFISCSRVLLPHDYIAKGDIYKTIRMDNTMHLTIDTACIDSVTLVRRVVDKVMSRGKNNLMIIVYFNGYPSWEFKRSILAAAILRDTLVSKGYDENRIGIKARFSSFSKKTVHMIYPYRKIDFEIVDTIR